MKDQRLDMDMISRLPESIIEIILTSMPIRDAVRTSVLSTNWRYKWANISKIVFDDGLVPVPIISNRWSTRHTVTNAINQILLTHRGPILELIFDNWEEENHFQLDQIILHLVRSNALKKCTLNPEPYYKLPSSFYSLQQLTYLNLMNCKFNPPSTFNGFNMLTSLYLYDVNITKKVLIHLVSGCPLLKSFTLLKFDLTPDGGDESNFLQLFEYFPVVEHLHLSFFKFQFMFYAIKKIPRKLPTSLVHLKDLELSRWGLMYEDYFSFALLLIRSSPNLEKIKIKGTEALLRHSSFELQDYQDVRLDRLVEFEIEPYNNCELESKFLDLIVTKSPMLKKVRIELNFSVKNDDEILMLRSLLRLQCISPMVETIVENPIPYNPDDLYLYSDVDSD